MKRFIMPLVAATLAICAAGVLNLHDPSMKWNIPIFWTGITFFCTIDLCREQWKTKRFWFLLFVILAAHALMMWILFSVLYSRFHTSMVVASLLVVLETVALLRILREPKQKSHPTLQV